MKTGANTVKSKSKSKELEKRSMKIQSDSYHQENQKTPLEKMLSKADKLLNQGEIDKGLELFLKIIKKKFKVYMEKVHPDNTEDKKENINEQQISKREALFKVFETSKNRQLKNPKPIKYKMKETLSEEDANLLRKVIIDFNKCAMQYLNFDKIAESNIDCINKIGDLSKGLKLLHKALNLAKISKSSLPLTYINLSAICSELNKHQSSLKYAQNAANILSEICQIPDDYGSEENDKVMEDITTGEGIDKENISLLAVSLYNVGSQYEFLNKYEECKASFEKAIQILQLHFNQDYPLIEEFKRSLEKVTRKIERGKSRSNRTFSNMNHNFIEK